MNAEQELANWIRRTGEKGGEFLEREAPTYVHELLLWTFVGNFLLAGICVIVLLLCVVVFVKVLPYYQRESAKGFLEGKPGDYSACLLLSTVVGLFVTITLVFSTLEATKALVSPRVVVVEHVATTLRR